MKTLPPTLPPSSASRAFPAEGPLRTPGRVLHGVSGRVVRNRNDMALGEDAALALSYALGDLEAMPVDAPKHVRDDVGRWAVREFRAGNAQRWLGERFPSEEWPEAVAGELRHATWLLGRSQRRPHLRRTSWAELLDWSAAELDALAPAWEERLVLHRFADGWTIEHVSSNHDLDLEGRLMRHCLNRERGRVHDAILSLRDPGRRPHVTLVIERSEITQTVGRGCSRPSPAQMERVAEYAKASGLQVPALDAL